MLFLQVENEEVARRILNDPVSYTPKFSKECKDICEGLMEKDPTKRLGFKNNECAELKNQPFFKDINWGRLEAGDEKISSTAHVFPNYMSIENDATKRCSFVYLLCFI